METFRIEYNFGFCQNGVIVATELQVSNVQAETKEAAIEKLSNLRDIDETRDGYRIQILTIDGEPFTTPISGVAAIPTKATPTPVTDFAEYEYIDGVGTKRVYKGGKEFAIFECDESALPLGSLVESARQYYKEEKWVVSGFNPTPELRNSEIAGYVCEFMEWADDFRVGDLRRPKWIRCSLDSGNPYNLEVAEDTIVCEACDAVLGNYSADEIHEASRNMFKYNFEQRGLSELISSKYEGAYIKWDIRTAFLAGVISAIARFEAIDIQVYEAPESEWVGFCKNWNELCSRRKKNNALNPSDETLWHAIYKEITGRNFNEETW